MAIFDEKSQVELSKLFNEAFAKVCRRHDFELEMSDSFDWVACFEKSKQESFGDLAFSGSLKLFATMPSEYKKKIVSPMALAQEIANNVSKEGQIKLKIKKLDVIRPGFINMFFENIYFSEQIDLMIRENATNYPDLGKKREVIVEFSSPNIAKPFTIGHLRSTIIGNAVANLLEAVQYKVYRDNHLGDWGTQFGKQIVAVEKWGDWDKIAKSDTPIKDLVDLYVEFHERAVEDPTLEDEARAAFKKLEEGDEKMLAMWEKCIDLSLKEFNKIYTRLGVKFTENEGKGYGEGVMVQYIPQVIEELSSKKLLKESEGAQVVFFEDIKLPPLIIIKKDDSSIYASRDLATDYFRRQMYPNLYQIINEVGMEQNLYFKQLYKTEEMLGWFKSGERVHISHGLYRFKDRKMSTRKGDVIWLEDVLNEAFDRVKAKDHKDSVSDGVIDEIAMGALKWSDLSREAKHNIDFDFDEILNVKGNSGPYMQYSVVRIVSILNSMIVNSVSENESELLNRLRKDNVSPEEIFKLACLQLIEVEKFTLVGGELSEDELALVKKIAAYYEVIAESANKFAPHVLCNYLYELASEFSTFYAQEKIMGNKKREYISLITGLVIHNGLKILGIKSVPRM
ncbi:MAG: arginine--tRNA ligase [Pseudomonadales bacterium]|jgi:arginyl-tRNA synthetase|nr:arginine--tRNA ligase [Pseudomonadales bacterium]